LRKPCLADFRLLVFRSEQRKQQDKWRFRPEPFSENMNPTLPESEFCPGLLNGVDALTAIAAAVIVAERQQRKQPPGGDDLFLA